MLKLQIVDESGVVVTMPGGGPLEAELVEHCVAVISRQPIGFFTRRATVQAAIRGGLRRALQEIKDQTRRSTP